MRCSINCECQVILYFAVIYWRCWCNIGNTSCSSDQAFVARSILARHRSMCYLPCWRLSLVPSQRKWIATLQQRFFIMASKLKFQDTVQRLFLPLPYLKGIGKKVIAHTWPKVKFNPQFIVSEEIAREKIYWSIARENSYRK